MDATQRKGPFMRVHAWMSGLGGGKKTGSSVCVCVWLSLSFRGTREENMQARARGCVWERVCKCACLGIVVKYMHVRECECECYYHSNISL